MRYYLYILKSESVDRFYIGISSDPNRRLIYHNSTEKGFTARYRPWRIVFEKEFPNRQEALKAEKKVKAWKNKGLIQKLVQGKVVI